MAGKHCWRCGGEMSSYASSCPWCGRSVLLSTLTQLVGLAIVVVVGLVITGTVSWDELKSAVHLRGTLTGDIRQPGGEQLGDGTGGGRHGGGSLGAPGPTSAPGDRAATPSTTREPRSRKSRYTITVGCEESARAKALRRRHPDWQDWVQRTAGCGEVAAGFDTEQVKAVLGEPDSVVRGGAGREAWIYGARRVELRHGRVVALSR